MFPVRAFNLPPHNINNPQMPPSATPWEQRKKRLFLNVHFQLLSTSPNKANGCQRML